MKQTQLAKLKNLLKRGATSWQIVQAVGTTCPHKRLADLKAEGWTIKRKQLPGQKMGIYTGKAPQ